MRKLAAANRRVENVYGITGEQYDAIYAEQGGLCPGCRKANGRTKRLSVDHDHSCTAGHPPEVGCPLCVRGLLCGRCNRYLGIIGDDPEILESFARYLRDPPARRIL
jgi:hypothetical protein